MATTILSAFQKLRKENLVLSTRQNNIREVVEKDLAVSDSFLTGSYSRSTMIAPLKEANTDIFIFKGVLIFDNYIRGERRAMYKLI